jgi:small GTP-binding protein
VGKSALFNRLVRRREALVHDTPGGHVTRDYQEAPAQLGDLRFKAVDTSGLEPFLPGGSIQARATALTAGVLRRADVALLLLDARTGVLPPDEALARWLRASASAGRVVLAANKCERRGAGAGADVGAALAEAARLGFGAPVALSAETGEGMAELFEALRPRLDPIIAARAEAVEELKAFEEGQGGGQAAAPGSASGGGAAGAPAATPEEGRRAAAAAGPLKLAIMGLVNVGKSTLTNRLLEEERCLTGPEPGLTRDAIKTLIDFEGRAVELVDTAGWVRRARLAAHDDAGGAVAARTLEEGRSVLRFVHVVALVVDAVR